MKMRSRFWTGCRALAVAFAVSAASGGGLELAVNPYEGVDWAKAARHKANLHTHTVASGGKLSLRQTFAEYAERGYTVLAVTDHDLCTQWEKAGIDPVKEFGVLPVLGREYSRQEHINGLFVHWNSRSRKKDAIVEGVAAAGGMSVLNHPGRYWKPDGQGRVPQKTVDDYVRMLNRHPSIPGIEVVNRRNRHPHDMLLWDALLSGMMPARPVWGFANDDMHKLEEVGQSWNVFLLGGLDEAALRRAMQKGCFYFSTRAGGEPSDGKAEPPVIQAVAHNPETQTLTVSATDGGAALGAEHYRWIAQGRELCTGPVLNYGRAEEDVRYARVEIKGKGGTTCTNPFGFKQTGN